MENSLGVSRLLSKKPRISDSRYQPSRDVIPAKYLPDHLIYEILLRTPAESLLKFKSVCKAWCALIKDRTFATQHYYHHKTGNQSIVIAFISVTDYAHLYDLTILKKFWESEYISCNLGRQTEELELKVHPDLQSLQITSCNGLVFFYAEYPVLLWNPITKECVAFREPDIEEEKETAIGCGFGFDATNNEYKVVILFERFPDSPLECEVLVLGNTMSWRQNQCQDGFDPGSVFVEGSIYWLNDTDILCFDVAAEKFKLIPTPDFMPLRLEFGTGCSGVYLVKLDGSLCYMEHVLSGGRLGIWKMQKDLTSDKKNPWIMECIIDANCINIREAHVVSICIQNKKIYLKYGEGLACYDTQSKELIAPIFTKNLEDGLRFDSIAFTKSIVCLQDIVGSCFSLTASFFYH